MAAPTTRFAEVTKEEDQRARRIEGEAARARQSVIVALTGKRSGLTPQEVITQLVKTRGFHVSTIVDAISELIAASKVEFSRNGSLHLT